MAELLDIVGLRREDATRYPAEFSGGQKQRIGIARALATQPKILALDEPVSALDVSIQAGIINLLLDLQQRFGLSYLFVSHDLSVVKHLAHRVAVMYKGTIVEQGDGDQVFTNPQHDTPGGYLQRFRNRRSIAARVGPHEDPTHRCGLGLTMITALTLTACSGSNEEAPSAGGSAEVGTTNDINPQDRREPEAGRQPPAGAQRLPAQLQLSAHRRQHRRRRLDRCGPRCRARSGSPPTVRPSVNTDYFTSIELTSTDPQVVTYTINPKAVWSDGTPITWEDLQSQINATSGKDKGFAIAATNGSDRVEKVERGVDDRQAVITFAKRWADWKGHVRRQHDAAAEGLHRHPRSVQPGAAVNDPGPSAGPFVISNLDRGAKRITLTRNPKWWGQPPLLDSITYLILDDAARIPALQNNTIDASGLATLDEMEIARRTQGITIRRAPGRRLVSLHVQRGPGQDPGRSGTATRRRAGNRPQHHRRGDPARARRQSRAAEQSHLRRRPRGLSGQQRRRRVRPREGQAGTRCSWAGG